MIRTGSLKSGGSVYALPQSEQGGRAVGNVMNIQRRSLLLSSGALMAVGLPRHAAAVTPFPIFQCYFDEGSAELSVRAIKEIELFTRVRHNLDKSTVWVQGHAEDPGSPEENRRLSIRRALSVGKEIERLGVPETDIVIVASGNTRPQWSTGSPGNRFVQLFLWQAD